MTKNKIFLSDDTLEKALHLLNSGKLVALPTETVYGLAADACSDKAVASVFALKERPAFNPLIAHFYSPEQIKEYTEITPLAETLLKNFAPGPLTLVLNRKRTAPLSDLVTAGLDTLAVRIPNHPIAQYLLEKFGRPLAAPSANPSETLSPTQASHVKIAFKNSKNRPFIIDGGPCQQGLESTILDARGDTPILLRPGGLALEEIERLTGISVKLDPQDSKIRSPGQLKRHYAPKTPLKLNVKVPSTDVAYLAFGPTTSCTDEACLQLSATKDLEEAAANLFSMLRKLDSFNKKVICVAPIPEFGLGLAINDRLKRASYTKY